MPSTQQKLNTWSSWLFLYFWTLPHQQHSQPTSVSNSFFFFWLHHTAYGIFVPQRGMEPVPLQWELGVLTTELKVPVNIFHVFVFVWLLLFVPCNFWILVPWPRTEPRLFALKAPSPDHWTIREFPPILNPYLKTDRTVVPACLESQMKMGVHVLNERGLEELDLEWEWHPVRKANKSNQCLNCLPCPCTEGVRCLSHLTSVFSLLRS